MPAGTLATMGFPARDLDGLVGHWRLEGTILGKPLVQEVDVGYVLDDAYIRMHYLPSTVTPLGDQPYEALSYIGWDPEAGGRFVMFLFDIFGAAYSAPGLGETRDGGGVRFRFEYAQGPFVTDLVPIGEGWRIDQYSVGAEGDLETFGVKHLSR